MSIHPFANALLLILRFFLFHDICFVLLVYVYPRGYGSIHHDTNKGLYWLERAMSLGDMEARELCRRFFPQQYTTLVTKYFKSSSLTQDGKQKTAAEIDEQLRKEEQQYRLQMEPSRNNAANQPT